MTVSGTAARLVAGPRGRRLCYLLLAERLDGPNWRAARQSPSGVDESSLAAELAAALDAGPVDVGAVDAADLLAALADTVTWATYWQEPDGIDIALAAPGIERQLRTVAGQVAPAMPDWWSAQIDLERQVRVEWVQPAGVVPSLTGVAERVASWRAGELSDERDAADRPKEVSARWSGHWWSAPCLHGLPTSTRLLPGLGAAGLAFVEDELGWPAARCVPLAPTRSVRVYELRRAEDWAELVTRYPFEVTLSRRHDWWRATGLDSRWLVPDYAAVADDYDAVHLSAQAYLETAGRALDVGSARTLLAGWNPDETYWLTDCLAVCGPAQRWVRDPDDEPYRWRPAAHRSTCR